MPTLSIEKLIESAENAAEHTVDKMNKAHGAHWQSRVDLAKLIISISTAILVATITFSSSLLDEPNASFPGLLILSWVLFFITLICAVSCIYYSTKLHTSLAIFINSEPDIEREIKELNNPTSPPLIEDIGAIVEKYSNRAFNPLGTADEKAKKLILYAMNFLLFGLFLFLLFGAIQVVKFQPSAQGVEKQNQEKALKQETKTNPPNNGVNLTARTSAAQTR
jgi:hypothetical protein